MARQDVNPGQKFETTRHPSHDDTLTAPSLKSTDVEQYSPARRAALARMMAAGLPDSVIMNFDRLFGQVESGITGVIEESQINPVDRLDHLLDIQNEPQYLGVGHDNLNHVIVLRLNGGMGTGMGLDRAKSQLLVRDSLSFNDIMAGQLLQLNEETLVSIPLIHMTSFVTDSEITDVMKRYSQLTCPGIPSTFQQHKHPKLYRDTLEPATEADDDLNWNPPGHGDIYAALLATGIAEKLLSAG